MSVSFLYQRSVGEFTLEPSNVDNLSQKVSKEWPAKSFGFRLTETTLEVTVDMLSEEEKVIFDQMIVGEFKKMKNRVIDDKTELIIGVGFVFSEKLFSLSVNAQLNMVGIKHAYDAGWVQFPIAFSTMDDGEYFMQDNTEFTLYYVKGLSAKKFGLDSGRALRNHVNDCTTAEDVAAVQDNRPIQPYNP